MTPTSKFEILRRKTPLNASAIFQSPTFISAPVGTETAVRGLALGAHKTNPEQFDLAAGNSFIGHLTRRVVQGGLTLSDRVFGVTSAAPVGLESPFSDGDAVTVERAEEIECEGPNYLMLSGTGAVSSGTTVPQSLSFFTGRLRVAQAGDVVVYTLTANNLTPTDDGNNDLRIRAVAAL
jgi:hypothetical protein